MQEKQVRLLIVDDQEGYYRTIKEYAELCSHEYSIECAYAPNGAQALTLCRSWQPSIVLLDAHLPDVNGFGLLDKMLDGVASIVITSSSHSSAIEETAKRRGANGYIPKTENFDELDNVLSYIVAVASEQFQAH